jgi:hypothetical protein
LGAQSANFAVFCDDEPVAPTFALSTVFNSVEGKKSDSSGVDQPVPHSFPSGAVSDISTQMKCSSFAVFCDEPEIQQPSSASAPAAGLNWTAAARAPAAVSATSSFAVFCDEPEIQQPSSASAPAAGLNWTAAARAPAAVAATSSFAVFCDENDQTSASTGDLPSNVATPQKDLNSSLASLHWSPLSCIAEESTIIDGRASLLDGSMCKGIRSVGRSSRKRRFSSTDFAYEDTEVLPAPFKCAEPYNEIERSRLNRLVLGMLLKHPGMFGHAEAIFNQPFAFKATKGKAKERLKAFDCQWEVLESLGKGGFGTVRVRTSNLLWISAHWHLSGIQSSL